MSGRAINLCTPSKQANGVDRPDVEAVSRAVSALAGKVVNLPRRVVGFEVKSRARYDQNHGDIRVPHCGLHRAQLACFNERSPCKKKLRQTRE